MMSVGSLTRGGTTVEVVLLPFEEVYACHAGPVYRFCVSLLHDATEAEDVTANAFAAAFAAYARVQPPPDEVRPWLFRIARNASVDQLRRRARTGRLLGRLRHGGADHGDVESIALVRGELREVLAAMRGLRERERELVGLRVAGGLPFAEIGDILGMSEQAARTATRRALARVTAQLRGTP